MSSHQKALLTTVFEALGPDRVTRGLRSTGHHWSDCFLAHAISGEPDALALQLEKGWWKEEYFVATLIGVRVRVVNEVVKAWDHHEGAFRALAAEWLELNCAAVPIGRWSARDQRPTGQSRTHAGAPGNSRCGAMGGTGG